MADIKVTPLVACDNCGVRAPKKAVGGQWKKPFEWGHVRVAPTRWGTYPNNIDLLDLCPECNAAVHKAVVAALEDAKKPR